MPFIVRSFNSQKFQDLITNPAAEQFSILVDLFRKAIDSERESMCSPDDPAHQWGTDEQPLEEVLRQRLSQPDWYEGLTYGGGVIFDQFIHSVYLNDELGMENRLDSEGLSWEVIDEIFHQMMETSGTENASYLAFGRRPFRYLTPVPSIGDQTISDDPAGGLMQIQAFLEACKGNPLGFQDKLDEDDTLAPAQKQLVRSLFEQCMAEEEAESVSTNGENLDDEIPEYEPAHSVHLPEEIRQMLDDLKSIEKPMKRNPEFVGEYNELLKILERLSSSGRTMYVIADT